MLHLMDIFFLLCICLWRISQIQTCLCVVAGSGFVLTAPVVMRSSANYPAGPHGQLAKKTVNRPPFLGVGGFDTICTAVYNRCDSSTACRLCRLEPCPWFRVSMVQLIHDSACAWCSLSAVQQNILAQTSTNNNNTHRNSTQDSNIHLPDETLTLAIHEYLQLHASQIEQKTQHPSRPLHKPTTYLTL